MQKNLLSLNTLRKLSESSLQLWAVGGLIALSLLWLTIITEIDRDHQLLIKQGEAEATSLASNYAKQIDYLFLQVDQLSAFMTAAVSGPNPASTVQKMIDTLPKESLINPFFADENGIVRSSRTNAAINVDVSQQPYFIEHRNSESLKLKVQKPTEGIGYLKGKTVIRFSRRLNNKDGNFGGIITIGIL